MGNPPPMKHHTGSDLLARGVELTGAAQKAVLPKMGFRCQVNDVSDHMHVRCQSRLWYRHVVSTLEVALYWAGTHHEQ